MEYIQELDRRGKVIMLPIKDPNGILLKPGKVKYYNVGDSVTVSVNGEIKTGTITSITPAGMYLDKLPLDINTIQLGGRKSHKRKSRKNKSRRYKRV